MTPFRYFIKSMATSYRLWKRSKIRVHAVSMLFSWSAFQIPSNPSDAPARPFSIGLAWNGHWHPFAWSRLFTYLPFSSNTDPPREQLRGMCFTGVVGPLQTSSSMMSVACSKLTIKTTRRAQATKTSRTLIGKAPARLHKLQQLQEKLVKKMKNKVQQTYDGWDYQAGELWRKLTQQVWDFDSPLGQRDGLWHRKRMVLNDDLQTKQALSIAAVGNISYNYNFRRPTQPWTKDSALPAVHTKGTRETTKSKASQLWIRRRPMCSRAPTGNASHLLSAAKERAVFQPTHTGKTIVWGHL